MDAYLQPRQAPVIVEGAASDPFIIANTVFQGTVLGPPLWNTYFSDVLLPAEQDGGEAHAFADDMNVFKQFDTDMDNEVVLEDMQRTRRNVHKWGRQNRVIFDAGKEHLVVLHPLSGEGDAFKLLGCMVDTKLTMQYAVDAILAAARPKTRAILRTRSHYDVPVQDSCVGPY